MYVSVLCLPAVSMIAGCSGTHYRDCASVLLHGLVAGEETASDGCRECWSGENCTCQEQVRLLAWDLYDLKSTLQLLHYLPHVTRLVSLLCVRLCVFLMYVSSTVYISPLRNQEHHLLAIIAFRAAVNSKRLIFMYYYLVTHPLTSKAFFVVVYCTIFSLLKVQNTLVELYFYCHLFCWYFFCCPCWFLM